MTSTDEYFFLKLQIETEDSNIEIKKSHKDLKEILEQQNCKTNSISKTKSNDDIVVTNQVDQKPTKIIFPDDTIYKVQLFASSKKLQANCAEFKGLKNVSSTFTNNLYKYTYGETANFEEVCEMQKEAKKTGFKDAYIVAVKDGKSSKVTDIAKQ